MKFSEINNFQRIKYLASSYFILIGLLNFSDTLFNSRNLFLRDAIILIILSLPIIINKRLFYLGYGFLASIITFGILMGFIIKFLESPIKPEMAIWLFFIGFLFLSIGLLSSLSLIYIGTYSEEKNRFKLI